MEAHCHLLADATTGFLITEIVLGKKMLRQMMGGQVHVPDPVWRKLGWAWVLFFAGMGVLNLWWVAYGCYGLDRECGL